MGFETLLPEMQQRHGFRFESSLWDLKLFKKPELYRFWIEFESSLWDLKLLGKNRGKLDNFRLKVPYGI